MKKKGLFRAPELITQLFLVLLFTIFLLTATSYHVFTALKQKVFYTVCGGYVIVMLLVLLGGLIVGVFSPQKLWERIKPTSWTQILIPAYMVFTLISAILSPYPQTAWLGGSRVEGTVTIVLYCLFFYGVAKFCSIKPWAVYAAGGSVTIFLFIGILQLMGQNPFDLYPGNLNYYSAQIAHSGPFLSTVGNVGFVAAFLCLLIPAFWVFILLSKEKLRFLLLIPLAMALGVLLKIWVLAGLVGVFCSVFLIIPAVFPFSKKIRLIYWCSLGACVIGCVVLLYFVDAGSGLFHELHCILHGDIQQTYGSGRIHIWSKVLAKVPENLLFGTGPDTLGYAQIEPFETLDVATGKILRAQIDTAHSEYLNILFNQGLFALLAYVGALAAALVRWGKRAGKSLGVAVFGSGILAYCIEASFGISQCITTPFFWAFLGILEFYNDKSSVR